METENLLRGAFYPHSQIKSVKGFMNMLVYQAGVSFTTSGTFYYEKSGRFRFDLLEGFAPGKDVILLLPDELFLPPHLSSGKGGITEHKNLKYVLSLIWGDPLSLPQTYKIRKKRGNYIFVTPRFTIWVDEMLRKVTRLVDPENKITIYFSEFKKSNGFLLPHKIRIKYKKGKIYISLRKIQVNQDIPDGIFKP